MQLSVCMLGPRHLNFAKLNLKSMVEQCHISVNNTFDNPATTQREQLYRECSLIKSEAPAHAYAPVLE